MRAWRAASDTCRRGASAELSCLIAQIKMAPLSVQDRGPGEREPWQLRASEAVLLGSAREALYPSRVILAAVRPLIRAADTAANGGHHSLPMPSFLFWPLVALPAPSKQPPLSPPSPPTVRCCCCLLRARTRNLQQWPSTSPFSFIRVYIHRLVSAKFNRPILEAPSRLLAVYGSTHCKGSAGFHPEKRFVLISPVKSLARLRNISVYER